jgi:hypothetical protein
MKTSPFPESLFTCRNRFLKRSSSGETWDRRVRRASVPDQRQARIWCHRGVPLPVVETALLLACLRRLARPSDVPPLPRIRSLAYFEPIIDELLAQPTPGGYLEYLRLKLRRILDNPAPAKVQKPTLSDDR